MANAMVASGATDFANAAINFNSDTIKAALATAGTALTYDTHTPPNINNVNFWSDVSADLVGSPVALTTKSDTAGVLNCDNIVFPAVTGATVLRVWLYKDTGVAGTSRLFLMYDTAQGLPVVPNGGNITVAIDPGTFKLLQI